MEEKKVSKNINEFCKSLAGTWKVNVRNFSYDSDFTEKDTSNLIIEITRDEVLTNDYRIVYRWTASDDEDEATKRSYPVMIMEVVGKNELGQFDFEFRSDDYSYLGVGNINGNWMTVFEVCDKRGYEMCRNMHYKLLNTHSLYYLFNILIELTS